MHPSPGFRALFRSLACLLILLISCNLEDGSQTIDTHGENVSSGPDTNIGPRDVLSYDTDRSDAEKPDADKRDTDQGDAEKPDADTRDTEEPDAHRPDIEPGDTDECDADHGDCTEPVDCSQCTDPESDDPACEDCNNDEICSNCSDKDGWYDVGTSSLCCDFIPDTNARSCSCQEQELREYFCDGTICDYRVLDARTQKSGCLICSFGCSSNSQLCCALSPFCQSWP